MPLMNQKRREVFHRAQELQKVINFIFLIYFCGKLRERKLIFQRLFGKNNCKNGHDMKIISSLIKRESRLKWMKLVVVFF